MLPEKKNLLINVVVGGTFHFPMLVNHLIKHGHDVRVYTSTPLFKIKNHKLRNICRFIPMPVQIFRKVTGITSHPMLKYIDGFLFDFFVSIFMRDCDLLYGFATSSLRCGKKVKGNKGVYILDRACPHVLFQEDVVNYEYRKLGLRRGWQPSIYIDRSIKEYNEADLICVPSIYTRKTFLDQNVQRNKLVIAPLEATFPIPKPKIFNKSTNKFTIGVVGGSLARKGYLYLFQAFSRLSLPDAELIILANKKELHSCKKVKQLLDANVNIKVYEYVKDINTFYALCDIFCLPSVDEGFGMVIMEAMANSLPIITTSNVGASSYVKNHKNGFILPPRNIDLLIEKINFFYFKRNKIEEYGKASYILYKDFLDKNFYSRSLKRLVELAKKKIVA